MLEDNHAFKQKSNNEQEIKDLQARYNTQLKYQIMEIQKLNDQIYRQQLQNKQK